MREHDPVRTVTRTFPVVYQFIGYKNSGKTTLICALIPLLQQHGCTVAIIKHDAHSFEIDHPGTDTWQQRRAGAAAVAITSSSRTAKIEERGSALSELVSSFAVYDYILIEGFKNEVYPKIVLLHEEEDLLLLKQASDVRVAVVWEPLLDRLSIKGEEAEGIHYFNLDNSLGIANYLRQQRPLL